jgi:hypothetical protein
LSDEVLERTTLGAAHQARIELRGVGYLTGPPGAHSHGALLDWSIPKPDGRFLSRRMTELAIYEVDAVDLPVTVEILDEVGPVKRLTVPMRSDHQGRAVCEVFVEAREKSIHRTDDMYVLREFADMRVCFDTDSISQLRACFPTAPRPAEPRDERAEVGEELTADPFCPNGRVDFSDLDA